VFSKNYKDENKKKNRALLHPLRRIGNHYYFYYSGFSCVLFHNQKPSNLHLTMTQSQTATLNEVGIITQSQKKQQNLDRFYNWLLMTGNVYIANATQMEAAYQKID